MKAVIVTTPIDGVGVHIALSPETVYSVYGDTVVDDNTIFAMAKHIAEKLDENTIIIHRNGDMI